ncbi:MAG: hypothetical protein HMLKMBBP_01659 [Planctomycetes bacterium]|nr:hypothetical protein [Planctomycetota bacterium]
MPNLDGFDPGADAEHIYLLTQGRRAIEEWRAIHPQTRLCLSGAEFSGADLSGLNLRGAYLFDARLGGANLRGADLSGAKLIRADLCAVDLHGANLCHASLRGANLSAAHLDNVTFIDTNLADADFNGASLQDTRFLRVDLGGARNLSAVFHVGPSFVSAQTLALSRGRLPREFLRGCGLQDWEIIAVQLCDPDLTQEEIQEVNLQVGAARLAHPIQTRAVFISYTHADSAAVERIESALQSHGVRVWRDVRDLRAGPLDEQVRNAMQERVAVVVLSRTSLRSDWVAAEVAHACAIEKEQGRHVLCPIALDSSWTEGTLGMGLTHALKRYVVLDFAALAGGFEASDATLRLVEGLRRYYGPTRAS